jgi:hypothetical protein
VDKLNILFGTVEYFAREIRHYLNDRPLNGEGKEILSTITTKLENELLHDFTCAESIRVECLNNLRMAIDRITGSKEPV